MFEKQRKRELRQQVAVVQDVNERIFAPQRSRTFSEAAAEAAQYVIDLENKLKQFDEALKKERTRNDLVEEANRMLHEDAMHVQAQHDIEIGKLKAERDYYYRRFCGMRTKLEVNAGIILSALDEAKEPVKTDEAKEQDVVHKYDERTAEVKKYDPVQIEKEIEEMFLNHKEKKDDPSGIR